MSCRKFIKAIGDHLSYRCYPHVTLAVPLREGKEDRREGGREGSQSCTEEVPMMTLKPLRPNIPQLHWD